MAENDNKENEIDGPERGIDLDKMEVPKSDPAAVIEASFESESEKKFKEFEGKPKAKRKNWLKYGIVLAVSVIALVTVLFFLWQKKQVLLKVEEKGEKPTHTYLKIDPIITNLDENRRIKISLMIRYNSELIEQISEMDSVIRNDILMFLTSPDIKRMAKAYDSKTLRSYIEHEIKNIIKHDSIDEIIFSECKVY